MHDGGAGGGGHIPGGGHVPAHHPGQLSHAAPQHRHGHGDPLQTGYDQSGLMGGITPRGRLSRRQAKAAGLSAIAVFMIIFIVLLVI
jgi:hypothetical protein